MTGEIYIGTSGWHYDHWRGPFYPEDLPSAQWLAYYTEQLHTAEINNTFYQLPEASTFEAWYEAVPSSFIFAVKANRYITHMKKLKDPAEPVGNLMERVRLLDDKLGPILFQLPPNWHLNAERLDAFLDTLPEGYRYAVELRDPTWLAEPAYDALAAHNAAFCIYELSGRVSPKEVTADFVYVRLHGPDGAYQGSYDTQTLSGWAGAFSTWLRQGKDVYCYFDNDQSGYAVQNALELQSMFD